MLSSLARTTLSKPWSKSHFTFSAVRLSVCVEA